MPKRKKIGSEEKKKKRKRGQAGSLEEAALLELNFTPEMLNELYDALEQARNVIKKYYSISARFPTDMRHKAAELMIESDLLILEFNELYVMSGGLIEKLKKKYLLGEEKSEILPEEKEVFQQKLDFVKMRVNALLNEGEEYIKLVRDYQKFQPLPTR